jgi:tetratricopeptide (TPR) repeat protein
LSITHDALASIELKINAGDHQTAESDLLDFIQDNPKDLQALTLLGGLYLHYQQIDSAAYYFEQIVNLRPEDTDTLITLTELLIDQGNNEQAIHYADLAVKSLPQSSYALCLLGIAYSHSNIAQAIHLLTKAQTFDDTNSALALNHIGIIYFEQQSFHEALNYFQAAIDIDSNSDYLNNFAQCHLQLGNTEAALTGYTHSLQKDENNPKALFAIASIYKQLNKLELAEQFALGVLKIIPNSTEALNLLGWIYIGANHVEKAHNCFNDMLTLDDTDHRAYIGKGTLLMERGDIDDAAKAFQQALNINPNDIASRCCLTQLKKSTTLDDNRAALAQLVNSSSLTTTECIQAHYALGKCYDDIKDYNQAFVHYQTGATLKRSTLQHTTGQEVQIITNIQTFFTVEKIEQLKKYSNSSSTPIFIIGMPRSGTTLTEQLLSSHPDVYGAGEIDFLSRAVNMAVPNLLSELPQLSADNFSGIANVYLNQLATLADNHNITDKMPGNFYYIGLIHALLPNAKIIHVQRNPIDTCWSCYTQLFDQGITQSYDFEELAQYYHFYNQLMTHWRKVLPCDAWLDINYEDMVNDKESALKSITSYCELTWNEKINQHQDNQRSIHTASVLQARQKIYQTSVNRWKNYQQQLQPLIDALTKLDVIKS